MSEEIAFDEFGSSQTNAVSAIAAKEPSSTDIALAPQRGLTVGNSLISPRETLDFQIKGAGKNKLLELSTPLMGLCVRIRHMGSYTNVDELHSRLSNEIANFQHEAAALGYDDATILAARYCLCSMVDESALSQPWGADSIWPERPMLSIFHNETWGGEKVFGILDRVMDEAHRFMDLLELIYYCLSLGFEGKYHVMHNGQARLDALMDNVYTVLEKHGGEAPDRLLNPDVNIYDQRQHMSARVPVWAVVLVAAACLVGLHVFFDQRLSGAISDIQYEIETTLGVEGESDA